MCSENTDQQNEDGFTYPEGGNPSLLLICVLAVFVTLGGMSHRWYHALSYVGSPCILRQQRDVRVCAGCWLIRG